MAPAPQSRLDRSNGLAGRCTNEMVPVSNDRVRPYAMKLELAKEEKVRFHNHCCNESMSDKDELTKNGYGAVSGSERSVALTDDNNSNNQPRDVAKEKPETKLVPLEIQSGCSECPGAEKFSKGRDNFCSAKSKSDVDGSASEAIISPWKTCIAMCLAYIFTYSAFGALSNLQSSLNAQHNLGMISLAMIYACFIIGSLVGPGCAILIGHKNILVLNFLAHLCYTCVNFRPISFTLLPVSAVFGICVGMNAMSKGVYLATISTSYIHNMKLPQDKLYEVMSFFYGIFYFSFKATQVTGNLMSSGILQPAANHNCSFHRHKQCGAWTCSDKANSFVYEKPSGHILDFLYGSFALCDILGLAIIVFGLPHLTRDRVESTKEHLHRQEMMRHLGGCLNALLRPKMLLLIPSVMAQSMALMIVQTGYTKDFVTCSAGVHWVGYSMVALGVMSSSVALGISGLARYTGRLFQFAVGMSADVTSILIMLVWEPSSYRPSIAMLLVVPLLAGVAQGILQPQHQALIGSLFPKEDLPSAYSALNCVKSLAYVLSLSVNVSLCLYHGLCLVLALYLLGVLGYAYTEFREWKAEGQKVDNGTSYDVYSRME